MQGSFRVAPTAIRRFSAWLLVALLAIIAGGGEGLHLLPGAGHMIVMGDQTLMLGARRSTPEPQTCGTPACCVDSTGREPTSELMDSESCPICKILGIGYVPAGPGAVLFWVVQFQRPSISAVCRLASPPAFYHARAPPMV